MKSCIYQLVFRNNDSWIGRTIDFEGRLTHHAMSFKTRTAASALQECYDKFGEPTAIVLMECHPDHLDFLERFYNKLLKPSLGLKVDGPVTDASEAIRYPELLTRSTVEHIAEIVGLRNSNMVLVDKLDQAHATIKKYEGLDEVLAPMAEAQAKALDLYETTSNKLQEEQNKTWLDKLLDRFR